jgi:hypothetical protein
LRTTCERKLPLPPGRIGGVLDASHRLAEEWTYLKEQESGSGASSARLERVSWTPLRESLCRQLVVGRTPPARASSEDSVLTCVLTSGREDGVEQALFLSDYNRQRGLPNFVAFVAPAELDSSSISGNNSTQDTKLAVDGLDVAYRPGRPEECCWCSKAELADNTCHEGVGRIGHLVPPSAFNSRSAADVFLNTVPMRQPFAELQWSRRLRNLFVHGQRLHRTTRDRPMHILIGPSLQADGRLLANFSSRLNADGLYAESFVDVPSFLWTAYADPYAKAAVGYICRNGGVDDECACVDGLAIKALEERLGFRLFPGTASADPHPDHVNRVHRSSRRQRTGTHRVLYYISLACVIVLLILILTCICQNAKRHRESKRRRAGSRDDGSKRMSFPERLKKAVMQRSARHSSDGEFDRTEELRKRLQLPTNLTM